MAGVWSLLIAVLVLWGARQEIQTAREIARSQARSYFNKDQAFRFWSTSHGGVYVPTNERTPPNPYLAHILERDIETSSGRKLTLMNPAYMLRQMMEEYSDLYGVKGHITSLKPLRPENAPDEWERTAIAAFKRGKEEVFEFVKIDGAPFLRLMRPMIAKKGCLKCHGAQGYKEGDVRGGVGVSLSTAPLFAKARAGIINWSLTLGLVWLLGLCGIGLGARTIRDRTHELEAAHEELLKRERLSVLGRMTAMVSHELRNPLGVIRSSAYYLNSRLDNADEKTRKHLERIEQQVGHCDFIVDELLEYTRGRRSEMLEGALNPWLEEVLDQIEIPDSVPLDYEPSPDIPMARFDQEKMRRVVINLVENALQAIIARQEGLNKEDDPYQPHVKVSTSITDNGVCVEVGDNGIGMDAETVNQAFEPLFTTRARGTGLGLAIVKKIVEEHGGAVSIESEPDRGTKAMVVIPLKSE